MGRYVGKIRIVTIWSACNGSGRQNECHLGTFHRCGPLYFGTQTYPKFILRTFLNTIGDALPFGTNWDIV